MIRSPVTLILLHHPLPALLPHLQGTMPQHPPTPKQHTWSPEQPPPSPPPDCLIKALDADPSLCHQWPNEHSSSRRLSVDTVSSRAIIALLPVPTPKLFEGTKTVVMSRMFCILLNRLLSPRDMRMDGRPRRLSLLSTRHDWVCHFPEE